MMTGDLVVGRFLTRNGRRSAGRWLRFVLAVPFLGFAFGLPIAVLCVLVAVGSFGYSASLAQQEVLVDLTPRSCADRYSGWSQRCEVRRSAWSRSWPAPWPT